MGDTVTFEVEMVTGAWTLYYLRSRKKGLGSMWCWADDERDRGAKVEGYWERDMCVWVSSLQGEGMLTGAVLAGTSESTLKSLLDGEIAADESLPCAEYCRCRIISRLVRTQIGRAHV